MAEKPAPTIAIVNDDEVVRDSLTALIEAHGFNVSNYALGRDFLRHHAARAADCLVLDSQLPDITGLDVLKSLRDRRDWTAAILITGVYDPDVHAKGRALGATAVLHKPVAHSELLAAIQKALASKKP